MFASACLAAVLRKRWRSVVFVNALAALGAMGVSSGAWAADGYVSNGIVTAIYVNEQLGPLAYITVSGAKNANPACSTNAGVQFVLSLTNPNANQMFAALLTARATQMPVTQLVGSGACDLDGAVETLIVVDF